jgi:hypothetical protein
MDLRGYLVRVSDGEIERHTVLLASDINVARLKALSRFKGTKWLVRTVSQIAQ